MAALRDGLLGPRGYLHSIGVVGALDRVIRFRHVAHPRLAHNDLPSLFCCWRNLRWVRHGSNADPRNDITESDIPSPRDSTSGAGEGSPPRIATPPYQGQHSVSETPVGTQPRARGDEIVTEVPLSEEEVKVGKRTVGSGEVKLQKKVGTEQVNVPVELKREDVVIERVPAHEMELAGKEPLQEERVEVPLSREEPVVEKETRVVGGVHVRKTEGTEQETIKESVRREDVDIDESGKISGKRRKPTDSGTGEEKL
jgi:uncharacterized protein (TIGR02271 family)